MKIVKDYINLLPGEDKKTGNAFRISKTTAAAAVFVFAWAFAFGWQAWQQWTLQQRLAPLTEKRQALQRELEAAQKELGLSVTAGMGQEKAALVNRILGDRVLWSEVFKQFSRLVPKGLWFDSLEGGSADRAEIRIRGGAFTYVSVSEFMLSLEKSGYFEKPQLMFAQKTVVQRQEVVGYEIVCGIRKAGVR